MIPALGIAIVGLVAFCVWQFKHNAAAVQCLNYLDTRLTSCEKFILKLAAQPADKES